MRLISSVFSFFSYLQISISNKIYSHHKISQKHQVKVTMHHRTHNAASFKTSGVDLRWVLVLKPMLMSYIFEKYCKMTIPFPGNQWKWSRIVVNSSKLIQELLADHLTRFEVCF